MAEGKLAIVFIDGNNLYHNLRASRIKPSSIDLQKLSQLVCERFKCIYKKTEYYNSIPDIRDGQETYYQHMKFLVQIRSLPISGLKTRKLQ